MIVNYALFQQAARTARAHGVAGAISSAREYLSARWHLRGARIDGLVKLRGRAAVENRGLLRVGNRVRLDGRTVRLELVCGPGALLSVGSGTFINYGTNISAVESVTIGRNCDIGQYTIIMDCDYHDVSRHRDRGPVAPVVIEDDVWLGARCIVLKGSRIGRGSAIGANSVVSGVIPPYSLAVGSPARVVRRLVEQPSA